MERVKIEMADPVFREGQEKTAKASFDVRPGGIACTAELWLSKDGTSKDATSGKIPFVSKGSPQAVNMPLIMPGGGFEYLVLVDVEAEGVMLVAFQATENVIIPKVLDVDIIWE